MAGKDYLKLYILETSHLHIAFFSVRQGQDGRRILTRVWVKGTKTIGVVAGVQTIYQGQICEVVHIYLHLQNHHHSRTVNRCTLGVEAYEEVDEW